MTLVLILSLGLSLFSTGLMWRQHNHLKTLKRMNERELSLLRGERTELLNKLMHVTGHTWELPPRPVDDKEIEIDEETKLALQGWKEV
jgi:hypothetical protein